MGALQAQAVGELVNGGEAYRVLCELETYAEKDAAGVASVKPPTWIQFLPAGPIVKSRDGRSFQISDLLSVAAATETPLVIDWDHESEWGKTRAAGWVEELRVQEGDGEMPRPGLWGRVAWTDEGVEDVTKRRYRFLSPVVIFADSELRDVNRVVSIALTNRPALRMHGLDSFRERLSQLCGPLASNSSPRGETVDPKTVAALRSAYGLAPDADDAAILQAAKAASSKGSGGGGEGGDAYREANAILKEQLSTAQSQLAEANKKLAEQTKAEFSAKVERVLEQAAKEGKVTPATAKKWREFCLKGEDNLAMFEADILPDLAKVGDEAPPSRDDKRDTTKPPRSGKTSKGDFSHYGVTAEEAQAAERYNAERRAAAEEDA